MLELFEKYISDNDLFTPECKILLGVSGGVDSMVMLNLFIRKNFNIGIAHCNFQLRGKESDDDQKLQNMKALLFIQKNLTLKIMPGRIIYQSKWQPGN